MLTRRRPVSANQGIEGLPLVPTLFELIGIAFSAWFVYRYLLFKPDRCVRGGARRRGSGGAARRSPETLRGGAPDGG
jgi:hypothetical protein